MLESKRFTTILLVIIIIGLAMGMSLYLINSSPTSSDTGQNNPDSTLRPSPLPITYVPPTFPPPEPTATRPTIIGTTIPNIELLTRDGQTITLDEYRGQIVVLNFWATWCPPCIEEMPYLNDFSQTSPDDVVVLSVTDPNNEQTIEQVNQFLEDNNIDQLPILLDQHLNLSLKLDVFQLPTTLFIDENGVIVNRFFGPLNQELMNDLLADVRNS